MVNQKKEIIINFLSKDLDTTGIQIKKFLKFTNYFINSITDYVYPMNWHFYDFKKKLFYKSISKIRL